MTVPHPGLAAALARLAESLWAAAHHAHRQDFALAPPAPQEPTVTDRTPQEPTVTTFRRKPLIVEARQVVGSKDGSAAREVAAWCGGWPGGSFEEPHVIVPTLEGNLRAKAGDWIVRGIRGEFHPVRGDIFTETYEPAVAS